MTNNSYDSLSNLTLLGESTRGPLKQLESFSAPQGLGEVILSSDEITSLCPKTGQPDFISAEITYQPRELCLESKSLKLYFWTFRDQGMFIEQMAVTICQDIAKAIQPAHLVVELTMKPRGGIKITASAYYNYVEEILGTTGNPYNSESIEIY